MPKKKYGPWEIEKGIGEGGQGRVFLVKDSRREGLGRFVLKRLKNEKRRDLFEREIKAVQQLNHPNILRIIEADLSGDEPYYVAEFCERGSLEQIGADFFKGDIGRIASVLIPIADALEKAHDAGVIHRDVKPQNILVRGDGTPVLADFGICHVLGEEKITLTDEAMGALNYIAPEMESGRRLGGPTGKTDVYSLGKVLYWMVSRGRIFARDDRTHALTEILADQRFEHVDMLLDQVVVENPANRLSVGAFKKEMVKVRSLVEGGYTPLKPSIGIQCRFCGLGKYERFSPASHETVRFQSTQRGVNVFEATSLRCNYCGHLEFFAAGHTTTWWDK